MNFVEKFVLVWLIFDTRSVLNATPLGVRNFEGVAQVDVEVYTFKCYPRIQVCKPIVVF